MFSQANFCSAIEGAIPTLREPLHMPACENRIYRQVDVLSHYVADTVCRNELRAASTALRLIERLYADGNGVLRGAIENVFVF